jgi:membrane-bound metal-dependent hydrolase YbcI (DUF457 family)
MASYRMHLTVSTGLGAIYGGIAAGTLGVPLPVAGVGAAFTALGGLMPDLDSDSDVPLRELFGLAGMVVPLMLLRHYSGSGLSAEETLLVVGWIYVAIRYGFSMISKYVTVHRGMFHSIPAMVIAGLATFLTYDHPVFELRAFLALGVMLGFLSHLVLDVVSDVDFRGLAPELKTNSGTAVKLQSLSWPANAFSHGLMLVLAYFAYAQYKSPTSHPAPPLAAAQAPLEFREPPPEKQPLRWQPVTLLSPTTAVPARP